MKTTHSYLKSQAYGFKKSLGLIKVVYISTFSLHTPNSHRNLNAFHETPE